MTREEAITYFESKKKELEDFREIYPSPNTVGYQATTKEISFYDMAISALSENKGDLISRQAVLDELEKWDWQELYLPIHFKQILDDVSPAENNGEWISTEDRPEGFCSKCDRDIDEAATPYCPYCGAKMTWVGAIHNPKFGNSMLVGKPSLLDRIIPKGAESEDKLNG